MVVILFFFSFLKEELYFSSFITYFVIYLYQYKTVENYFYSLC